MYYANQVSDELLEQWITEVLLEHPAGMTSRDIYETIRWHPIPFGTILDSHVVNSYLYSNCCGWQSKYKHGTERKPIWSLRHLQRLPVISQTAESIEFMVKSMVLKIVNAILITPSADKIKMAKEMAMKLICEKGSAITDMLCHYFNNNSENFVGDKQLFCAQKLSFRALEFLDDIDGRVNA